MSQRSAGPRPGDPGARRAGSEANSGSSDRFKNRQALELVNLGGGEVGRLAIGARQGLNESIRSRAVEAFPAEVPRGLGVL